MLIFVVGNAVAQDEPVFSADLTVDYNSKYVWRGIQVVDESVIQPGVSGSAYGFTGSIWANIDMTDINGTQGEFSEIDYALDYSTAIGESPVGVSAGIIHYLFPTIGATDASTTEIYFGAGFDTFLSPFITYYLDVNSVDGGYLQFGIGHSLEMETDSDVTIGLDMSASFGLGDSDYNSVYFGVSEAELNDFTASIGVPIGFSNGLSLTPSFNVSTLLGEQIGDMADYYDARTNVWFGLGFAKSF